MRLGGKGMVNNNGVFRFVVSSIRFNAHTTHTHTAVESTICALWRPCPNWSMPWSIGARFEIFEKSMISWCHSWRKKDRCCTSNIWCLRLADCAWKVADCRPQQMCVCTVMVTAQLSKFQMNARIDFSRGRKTVKSGFALLLCGLCHKTGWNKVVGVHSEWYRHALLTARFPRMCSFTHNVFCSFVAEKYFGGWYYLFSFISFFSTTGELKFWSHQVSLQVNKKKHDDVCHAGRRWSLWHLFDGRHHVPCCMKRASISQGFYFLSWPCSFKRIGAIK